MDSYLQIAHTVLKRTRQPLSARQILKTALQMQLVPRDLYGRTQHKTLQARLASDILRHRSNSAFYRTGPGRFFLRAFQSDPSLPTRYKHEYHAPLRAAQLGRFDVIAFPRTAIRRLATQTGTPFDVSRLLALPWRFARLYNLRRDTKLVPFRFLLLLMANDRLFIDNRQQAIIDGDFHARSTIGIEGYVKWSDLSLFSTDEFGLMDAAARAMVEQLGLPGRLWPQLEEAARWSCARAVIEADEQTNDDLVVYLRFQCSGISEIADAVDAQLSAEWITTPIKFNDLERFDKWSARFVGDSALQAVLCG
jgi:hypothetical protein